VNELRFQEPSAGCLLPGLLLGGDVVVGAVFAIGISESPPLPVVRLIAPIYAVASYWMLTYCNRRTVVVGPTGVRVTYGPIPNVGGQWIPRAQIAACYARDSAANYDEGEVPNGTYFAIGIETRSGQRLHLYSRDADKQTALAAAAAVSHVFHANPAEPPIEVRLVPAGHDNPTLRREFVFWGVLALAAVALGAFWELHK
jgi:hypothetical protein